MTEIHRNEIFSNYTTYQKANSFQIKLKNINSKSK